MRTMPRRPEVPLSLGASARGLDAARSALRSPRVRAFPAWAALLCAVAMAAAALALAGVVVLGGWEPAREANGDGAVRGALSAR